MRIGAIRIHERRAPAGAALAPLLAKETALIRDRLQCLIRAIPDTLPGRRDRALLLVWFAAALQPNEIAGLVIEHMRVRPLLQWRKRY
jgi:site-specific recombinase XerC